MFTLLPLEIEKQIQQIQAQRSNLPKVDIGEKVRKLKVYGYPKEYLKLFFICFLLCCCSKQDYCPVFDKYTNWLS